MQLASHGGRALAKARTNVSNFIPRSNHNPHPHHFTPPPGARSIHVSPANVRPSAQSVQSTAQKLFSVSRSVVTRFVAQLTAPSLIHVPAAVHSTVGNASSMLARRAVHTSSGKAGIQNGFSYPVRVALSRPIRPLSLPRGPGPVPCKSVAQVGLGMARNFSSSRPLFQNLVENVPIAGRAFYEADWDTKMRQEKENMRIKVKGEKKIKKPKRGEMMKPIKENDGFKKAILADKVEVTESQVAEEMDLYFAPANPEDVITTLLVPLAPTTASRAPLQEFPSNSTRLLPRAALMDVHNQHSRQTLRVSSLFARLDGADVWSRGVRCSAYAHGAIGGATIPDDGNGNVCTVLRVDFVGWRKEQVRSVIGECGTGWCVLEEEDKSSSLDAISEMGEDDALSTADSDLGSISSGLTTEERHEVLDDRTLSQSFVMPTLDFSSSFLSRAPSPSLPAHETSPPPGSPPSPSSELSSPSIMSFTSSTPAFVDPPSENGYFPAYHPDDHQQGFGFSSDFTERMEWEWERL